MEANGRQYGIDIARLASMFMVVLLHNLLQGGVLDWTLDSMRDLLYMTLENCSIIAVNIFARIAGIMESDVKCTFGNCLDYGRLLLLGLPEWP